MLQSKMLSRLMQCSIILQGSEINHESRQWGVRIVEELLFGWLMKPSYQLSVLDEFMFLIEVIIMLLVCLAIVECLKDK